MIYQLKRSPVNSESVWSSVFCIFFIGIFIRYCIKVPNPHPIMIIEALLVPLILAFAINRFLIEVEFDFYAKTIKTRSVIPFIKHEYSFDRIEAVRTPTITRGMAKNIDGIRLDNFVIKLRGNFQSQVYTIKTIAENEVANQIINKWNEQHKL